MTKRPPGLGLPARASQTRHVARAAACRAVLASLVALAPAVALAQAPPQVTGPAGEVAPVPAGDATIRGRVVLPGDPGAGADLPVALYALRADGQPGLTGDRTDAEGRFVFEDVSNEPSTVYLVGTQYQDVPFGRRITFEPGQREIDVELPLRAIVRDASAVLVVASVYKLDWVGGQLFVQVSHQLRSPGNAVVYVAETARSTEPPAFAAELPEGVVEFVDGQGGLGEGLTRDGRALSFWGPIYPGDQEVRYGFLLDGPAPGEPGGAAELALSWSLPAGAGEVQLLSPASDPRPRAAALQPLDEPSEIDGVAYVRSSLGGLSPGGQVAITLDVPASSDDATGLRIARADYWIDGDDTAMRVSAELSLQVDGTRRLLANGDEPLIAFALPEGAEFLGVSSAAQGLGVSPSPDGGLAVRGPLPPGASSLGFRFQLPVRDGLAALDLAFARRVDLLNVLVADTGVIVESPRLHKRRPFRSGTRVYLHREAYQVEPGEAVPIAFIPFERTEAPRSFTALAGVAIAALAAAFLVSPLRQARRAAEPSGPVESELAVEREAIYEALRDLEDDHDTGKVDDADYDRMRGDLRATAVELLRRERGQAAAPAAASPSSSARCPGCGIRVEPDWRFCSDCGERLEAADAPA